LADLAPILRGLERDFNREINATCYSVEEFKTKMQSKNHFLTSVLKKEKIFLVGDKDELEQLTGKSHGPKPRHQPLILGEGL